MARPIITYCRVSTKSQGRSGLGLEAHREALARFAASEGFEIVSGDDPVRILRVLLQSVMDARHARSNGERNARLAHLARHIETACWRVQ